MLTRVIRLKADTEVIVPVYRDNTDNDMAMITYLADAPMIEGELNYQQQLMAMHMRRLVRTIIGRSTLLTPLSPAATGVANEIRLHTADTIFHAAVNGIVKTVYAYDNPVSGTKVEGGNRVTLPDYLSSGRKDMVYLEMWFEEVMNSTAVGTADTTVYRNGMVHGFTDTNNIKVTSYGELHETTRRVQLRGQIRTVAGSETIVGVNAKTSTAYAYADVGGYLRAGTGDVTSAQNLNAVDGYTYAMPLLKVTRGANASTMTSIEVVAPSTATLQQLATSTLKDVAQFGADLAAMSAAITATNSRVSILEADNAALKQANSTLAAQITTSSGRIDTLNKLLSTRRHWYRGDFNHYDRVRADTTFKTTSFDGGASMFWLPPGYRLSIGTVRATLPNDTTNFWFLLNNPNTRIAKSWRWAPTLQTPRGGTYYFSGQLLIRDGDANIIQLPEYDSTNSTGEYILAYCYIQTNDANAPISAPNYPGLKAEVELVMTPK